MYNTTNTKTVQAGLSPYIISYADFLNEKTGSDTIVFANRESSRSQKDNHDSKEVLLKLVYGGLKLDVPFKMYPFEGSGRLCFVNVKGSYFDKLKRFIWVKLHQLPPGKKLYILFVTRSRLMRPAGYDPNNQSATWMYQEDDYLAFNQWVRDSFSTRTNDVRFVPLFHLSPADDRYFETWLGKFYKQCWNNYGKRLTRRMSSMFRSIVKALRKQGMTSKEIITKLELEYEDEHEKLPAKRTIRGWLEQKDI
jgi:hypothetical protein